jgi:hypothetical protein
MQNVPPIADQEWFYEDKGERKGTYNQQQIINLIKTGKLSYGSMVWKKGMPDWMQIERTELRHHLEDVSPPPLTGTAVNNKVVWVLAFAPLIGYLLESFIAGLLGSTHSQWERDMSENRYWYVTVILNITLCLFDDRLLKQAGYDMRRFKWWVFVVPVYLYQRAKLLKQNQACFIAWIVCFFISISAHQA